MKWAAERTSLLAREASSFLLTGPFENGDAAGEPAGLFWDVLSSPWDLGDRHAVEGKSAVFSLISHGKK